MGGNTCATVSDRFEMTLAEFLPDKLLPSAKSGLLGFGHASGPTEKKLHIMNTSSNPAQRRHHCHSRRRDLPTDQQSMDGKVANRRVGGNVRSGSFSTIGPCDREVCFTLSEADIISQTSHVRKVPESEVPSYLATPNWPERDGLVAAARDGFNRSSGP